MNAQEQILIALQDLDLMLKETVDSKEQFKKLGFEVSGVDEVVEDHDEGGNQHQVDDEQAVARKHAAGAFAEGLQQIEFGAGHRNPRACRITQFPQPEIDPPPQEGEGGRPVDGARGLGRGREAHARRRRSFHAHRPVADAPSFIYRLIL